MSRVCSRCYKLYDPPSLLGTVLSSSVAGSVCPSCQRHISDYKKSLELEKKLREQK